MRLGPLVDLSVRPSGDCTVTNENEIKEKSEPKGRRRRRWKIERRDGLTGGRRGGRGRESGRDPGSSERGDERSDDRGEKRSGSGDGCRRRRKGSEGRVGGGKEGKGRKRSARTIRFSEDP